MFVEKRRIFLLMWVRVYMNNIWVISWSVWSFFHFCPWKYISCISLWTISCCKNPAKTACLSQRTSHRGINFRIANDLALCSTFLRHIPENGLRSVKVNGLIQLTHNLFFPSSLFWWVTNGLGNSNKFQIKRYLKNVTNPS